MPGERALPAWVNSLRARAHFEDTANRPLLLADWKRAVFLHYEVDPAVLQKCVPYDLDLLDGRAYVSFVAFTLERMRPAAAPKLEWLFRPFSPCAFLNLRTYVEQGGERGIYFLNEWLSRALSIPLGPISFGLPYRAATLEYDHDLERSAISGRVTAAGKSGRLVYATTLKPGQEFGPSNAGSRDEFLLERYTAFTAWRGFHRFFRVWHEPWRQTPVEAVIPDASLLYSMGEWAGDARFVGAHFSPGARGVWMGSPERLSRN
jgi:hypothetical protein